VSLYYVLRYIIYTVNSLTQLVCTWQHVLSHYQAIRPFVDLIDQLCTVCWHEWNACHKLTGVLVIRYKLKVLRTIKVKIEHVFWMCFSPVFVAVLLSHFYSVFFVVFIEALRIVEL
jgi:hypothetical protein